MATERATEQIIIKGNGTEEKPYTYGDSTIKSDEIIQEGAKLSWESCFVDHQTIYFKLACGTFSIKRSNYDSEIPLFVAYDEDSNNTESNTSKVIWSSYATSSFTFEASRPRYLESK